MRTTRSPDRPCTSRSRWWRSARQAPRSSNTGILTSRATIITESKGFEGLGLSSRLLKAVAQAGYTEPTPIQKGAIPEILDGRDLIGGAQTGTGKTAAFALPILQILEEEVLPRKSRNPYVLVMTPTRELAAQILDSFEKYGGGTRVRSTVVFGGVGFQPQADKLRRGIDVLVATPGRLLDHCGQGTLKLSDVDLLVLDEADRMLDMGFIRDIRKVIELLPKDRQNLLFSATYSDEIRSLASRILHDPAQVEVTPRNTTAEMVEQCVYLTGKSTKRKLLARLVKDGDWQQVLVFTRTKHGANRLAQQLDRDGIDAAAIHGNKSQSARTKALAGFKSGDIRVLVATDIAARGLDIDRLPHVVNYELPNVPSDYVHRIGRTGRAGRDGEAISLVSVDEAEYLQDIQKLLGREIEQSEHPDFPAEEFEIRAPAKGRHEKKSGGGRGGNRGGSRGGGRGGSQGKGRSERSGGGRKDAPRHEKARKPKARDHAGGGSAEGRPTLAARGESGGGRKSSSKGSSGSGRSSEAPKQPEKKQIRFGRGGGRR